jgi:transcriptional regulator with PAS, ATPase and Fis domain
VTGISAKALSLLMAHDWPGNVRELENVIERAFILCGAENIGLQHLPENLTRAKMTRTQAAASGHIKDTRAIAEAQAIRLDLERSNGNRQAAARALGIHKTTLFRKIKALGLEGI